MSGPRYCNNYIDNEINDDIYKTSSDNDISGGRRHGFQTTTTGRRSYSSGLSDEELVPRSSRHLELDENSTYPVVIVEHGSADYRTILAGVPANFGLNITETTKVGDLL